MPKKPNPNKCEGIDRHRNQCKTGMTDPGLFCDAHSYMKDWENDLRQSIKETTEMAASYKSCDRCGRWHNDDKKRCLSCREGNKEKVQLKKAAKKDDKCKAITRYGTQCTYFSINEGCFCAKHQFMVEYTPDMLANLTQCSGCRLMVYKPGQKMCDSCSHREKPTQSKTFEKCEHEGCGNKANMECEFPTFCGLHQLNGRKKAVVAKGNRVCINFGIRHNCSSILVADDYSKETCENCLAKNRESDNKRRSLVKEKALNFEGDHEKCCCECGKVYLSESFVGHLKKECTRCLNCRENDQKGNAGRDKVHVRELARINEKNPERMEKKRQYYEEHSEDLLEKCQINRAKRRLEDPLYFEKRNNEQKNWRENNPEKVAEINKNSRLNPQCKLYYYKYRAKITKIPIEWAISDEQCYEMFNQPCTYCGSLDVENALTGIDRVDNNKGYLFDNVVPCCETCNMLKYTSSVDEFIKRIKHILRHTGFIQNEFIFPECFPERIGSGVSCYIKRALKQSKEFALSLFEFDAIQSGRCYLCGLNAEGQFCVGIDKIDNTKGYTVDNIAACCTTCNKLKNNYEIKFWIAHLLKVVEFYESLVINKTSKTVDVFLQEVHVTTYSTIQNFVSKRNHRKTLDEIIAIQINKLTNEIEKKGEEEKDDNNEMNEESEEEEDKTDESD